MIGNRLKEERKRLGYNQEDFAAVAGITRRPYAEWEASKTFPNAEQLAALSSVGADVQYIVTGARSEMALTPDERELLRLFRDASLAIKAAAIGALKGASTARQEQVFHGKVGQSVQVEGDLDQSGISFFGKPKKKK